MFLKCFEYNQHFVAMMNVINKARLFPPAKGHKHHIIPKSWFKINGLEVDNSEKNLVVLSKEDHCKVHKLAMLCVKDKRMKQNMACACHFLGMPGIMGYKLSEETKRKMSIVRKGRTPKNFETLAKINTGKKRTKETCKRMSESHIGKSLTEETKRKLSMVNNGKFGKNFYDHYGITRSENIKLYTKEYNYYARHGFCSWEK